MSFALSAEVDKNLNKNFMTTKELAEKLHCETKTIFNIARKCLPNKVIENGKTTFWNNAEITVLIEQMKTSQPNQHNLVRSIQGVSTELTPALKIKKAFDLMQEGYEEEMAILKAKNLEQQKVIDRIANSKGLYSINQTAKALKLPYGNITLYEKLRNLQILNKDNSPKQEQINNGNFKVVVKFINNKVGSRAVTLTTGKGLVYLAKKFNMEIDESVSADS